MNPRIARLRTESFLARPSVSAERAVILTEVYRRHEGRVSNPVLRALAFRELCERKTVHLGDGELIVGERGPRPKATPTYPELTCHSLEDLAILRDRPMTSYAVDDETIRLYRETVIPFWAGRAVRDRAFADIDPAWRALYESGVFTEFMEQRAPGHTALDGSLYRTGLRARRARATELRAALMPADPDFRAKADELEAMAIVCDGAIRFAERHAEAAEAQATTAIPERAAELRAIAARCRRVPAEAPRDFAEAIQAYWFVHLGTITELNGWDAMSPGRFDVHLAPFYRQGLADGTLTRESAKELLACFWIKVNNTPAPPKVGVTAAESGTYNDFTNINLGGLLADGTDASNEVSYLILEVLDELRLLQPQANVQVSLRTPDRLLQTACRVIRNGSGYPSLFNADEVVLAQTAMGKTLADAREGGTSGCVETGCFGKEAYILHGYLNLPKLLELALHEGVDPLRGLRVGAATGPVTAMRSVEDIYQAFLCQLRHVVQLKIEVSNRLDRIYAEQVPAPFLSLFIADCLETATDYYCGGARYNTDYIQCCGVGTVTDALGAIERHVFRDGRLSLADFVAVLDADWAGHDALRARIAHHTPFFGNDDDAADRVAVRLFNDCMSVLEGNVSHRGGTYHADFLSTTCHVYFGKMTGASADGRRARTPLSDGTSPSHGADRHGPTAVMNSLAKLDQARSGGTLLNQRFEPAALAGDAGLDRLAALVRGYFRQGGHHVQFNVVDEATLRAAQKRPEDFRHLLVRVAGYSDYFVDLDAAHQEEIIARTAQTGFGSSQFAAGGGIGQDVSNLDRITGVGG
jgi:formate C-acetyltransferase